MQASKVYFTDFHCHPGLNQQQKLRKLMLKAGMDQIDFRDKFVCTSANSAIWPSCARTTQKPWPISSKNSAVGRS